MKCDSEVRFGVGGIFLPIKWLLMNSETGVLVSKIWSGIVFCTLINRENDFRSSQFSTKYNLPIKY